MKVSYLELRAITFKQACEFIAEHHRHHIPPVGWKFGTSVYQGGLNFEHPFE